MYHNPVLQQYSLAMFIYFQKIPFIYCYMQVVCTCSFEKCFITLQLLAFNKRLSKRYINHFSKLCSVLLYSFALY